MSERGSWAPAVHGGLFQLLTDLLFCLPEVFTEQLLEQHDNEVAQMKCYYKAHQELFEAVHKWEENWHLFQELEVATTLMGLAVPGLGSSLLKPTIG